MPKVAGKHRLSKTVEELGERRVIEELRKHLELPPSSPVLFGDDVAAVPIENDHVAILKTDMLVNKTDVPPGMNLQQAARKAVVMNVSDFAAKGVQPLAALVSLGLPRTLKIDAIKEIAVGLNAGSREYGAFVVGGDTGESSDVVITVSLYGTALKSRLMLRTGARPNDVVGVTGSFGKSAAGLQMLTQGCKVPERIREVLLDSVFVPKARLQDGLALAASGTVTSSIDSSDGLAWSLHELSKMSKVGFVIDHIPIADEAEQFAQYTKADVTELVFYGGEEYELVVTVKPDSWRDAQNSVEKIGGTLSRIGKVTREKRVVLEQDGRRRSIEARGWEHFKNTP